MNKLIFITGLMVFHLIGLTHGVAQKPSVAPYKEYLSLDLDTEKWDLIEYGIYEGGDEFYFFNFLVAKTPGGGKFFAFRSKSSDPLLEIRVIVKDDYQKKSAPGDYLQELIRIREYYCIGNEDIEVIDTGIGELTFSGKFGKRCFGYKPEERMVRIFFGERHENMRHVYIISYVVKGRFFTEEERRTALDYVKSAAAVY